MLNLKTFAFGAAWAVASLGALAQATTAPVTPRVDAREANQQKRIDAGVDQRGEESAGAVHERAPVVATPSSRSGPRIP